jgi:hypothetical protein
MHHELRIAYIRACTSEKYRRAAEAQRSAHVRADRSAARRSVAGGAVARAVTRAATAVRSVT